MFSSPGPRARSLKVMVLSEDNLLAATIYANAMVHRTNQITEGR